MPLLGSAAMLLSFDIEPSAIDEHDHWHTQEHLPERLAIPGFHRGTRWIATHGWPRYMVLYEVENLDTLTSAPYLKSLNHPTPWTASMMPHYRGMARGLCTVLGSFGTGKGGDAALIRFTPDEARAASLHQWLVEEALPSVPRTPGFGSAHLLQGAKTAELTTEQRIRGADRAISSAIILTGYDEKAVAECAKKLSNDVEARGARELNYASYRWSYSLSSAEVRAGAA